MRSRDQFLPRVRGMGGEREVDVCQKKCIVRSIFLGILPFNLENGGDDFSGVVVCRRNVVFRAQEWY